MLKVAPAVNFDRPSGFVGAAIVNQGANQHCFRTCNPLHWFYLYLVFQTFRYNPNTGELTLVSEKYQYREDNRRHAMEMMTSLIDEGRRKFPNLHADSSPPFQDQEDQSPSGDEAVADGAEKTAVQAA